MCSLQPHADVLSDSKEKRRATLSSHSCFPNTASSADAARLSLDAHLVSLERIRQDDKRGEGDVDQANDDHDDVADLLHVVLVSLRDSKCRCYLLPAKARMSHKDNDGENVE